MARWPGMRPDRVPIVLEPGMVIQFPDGTRHYVEYVNSSGAFAVPLTGTKRSMIKTDKVTGAKSEHSMTTFEDGRAISARSIVEVIHPAEMGVSSLEYQRYVKMAVKSGTLGRVKGMNMDKGTSFGEFDQSDLPAELADLDESDAAEGLTAGAESSTAQSKESKRMAKKAARPSGNGAAKREKAPKTVRKCTCGCGAETTGYFAPGHDARYHGYLKKLADGRMELKEIPASLRSKLDIVATKEGHRVKNPNFYKD